MSLVVTAVEGLGEVAAGTSLVDLVAPHVADGEVVVITSKVVSKAEGQVVRRDRATAIAEETVRVVACRGATTIAENHLGLVMAAAGVDASNVAADHVVLLPRDPDASARALREGVRERTGHNVAVVVSDTAGRAWRTGQTDIAVGVAGIEPLESFAGRVDGYGNELAVTAPATADELAGIAEVASGKLGGRPVVLVAGLAGRVLPPGEHGPGARALLRPRGEDMFGLGAREAVVAALRGDADDAFGAPAAADDLLAALLACGIAGERSGGLVAAVVPAGDVRLRTVLGALLVALGWQATQDAGSQVLLSPRP